MARFTRLRLENWKNFGEVDVALQQRVFIVGPNGSGKSNLLDALRFLKDLASSGGGLQEAVRRRGGVASLRSLFSNPGSPVAVTVHADIDGEPWEYRIVFRHDEQFGAVLAHEVVKQGENTIIERPDNLDIVDPKRLTQTHLEQVATNQRFRSLAEFMGALSSPKLLPHLMRDPGLDRGGSSLVGRELVEEIAATNEVDRQARLSGIEAALRIAVPHLVALQLDEDRYGRPELRASFAYWRAPNSWQSDDKLSDGTLRLIGLLWSLYDGPGTLLIEEPELSLHPEIIRYFPMLLYRSQERTDRQIALTTHAAEMFADPGIGLDEVLLLLVTSNGTVVTPAIDVEAIRVQVDAELPLGDIITAWTAPGFGAGVALAV